MSVIAGLILLLQLPGVQTFVSSYVLKQLQKNLNADITVEKIHLKPFNTLVIKNILLKDKDAPYDSLSGKHIDTLFHAEYVIAGFSFDGLFKRESIQLKNVYVENGTMNLVSESRTNAYGTNLNRMFNIPKNSKKKKGKNPEELFRIKTVVIRNFRFTLSNYDPSKDVDYGDGINWNDLDVYNINLDGKNLRYKGGIMSGKAEHLDFREKSGYICNHLEGSAKVGNGLTHIEDLIIQDPWSDVHLAVYEMYHPTIKSFLNYISEVRMVGEIEDSYLDFKTLSYFADALKDVSLKLRIKGSMDGTVDDFIVKDLNAVSQDGGFSATVNGSMKGLPQISTTVIDARLNRSNITAEGLGKFISAWTPGSETDLGDFAKGIIFMPEARVRGTLNKLNIKADVNSFVGRLRAELQLKNLLNKREQTGISGTIETDRLDIGKIANVSGINEVSMTAGLESHFGKGRPFQCKIDSLNINRLGLFGYNYTGIASTLKYNGYDCDARIICNDPSLNFLFQGSFITSQKTGNTAYQFYANIGNADLNAMNLDKRGRSKMRLTANANFTHRKEGDILGRIDLGKIVLENKDGIYRIGDISLASQSNEGNYRLKLNSDFADITYSGSAFITGFFTDMQNVALKRELPALYKKPSYQWKGNSYNFIFNFHNSMDLMAFAMPGLYIADSTYFNANIDKSGLIKAKFSSPRIAYDGNYLKGVRADFHNADSALQCNMSSDEIRLATLSVLNNDFKVFVKENHIGLGFTYDNKSNLENRGELYIRSDLSRVNNQLNTHISLLPSTLYINSQEWNIMPSEMEIAGKDINISNLELTGQGQSVRIFGRTSVEHADTLTLQLERLDLAMLNPLLNDRYGIKGAATGSVQLTSPLANKGLLVDMVCDSTSLSGTAMGTLSLHSAWNDADKKFDMEMRNSLDGTNNIDITADYSPKNRQLNAVADLYKFRLDYASPLLETIFSETSGEMSGKIHVNGTLDRLNIRSEDTRLENTRLKVAYTNVNYYPSGNFHIGRDGLYFDKMTIRDDYSGNGELNGSINWNKFKNFRLGINIRANNLEALNLSEKQGEAFYGHLFATGNVAILGPMDKIQMNIDAICSQDGQIHIPLKSNSSSGKTNLLKFKERETTVSIDPYELMMNTFREKNKKEGEFNIKLRVNANPAVEAFVEIDKASGNVLTGRGNGLIDIDAGKDRFQINGDYSLTSGNYKFVALGLASRDFSIQEGSSIRFNGDIMESSLDIDAIYRTKASLSTLISDTTSVANNRLVECGIKITDKLSNPRLKFSITVPDVDPIVKPRVDNALSTEDKIQKQFLSLIVSNNFLPDEQSGIVNNTSLLYSNVSEILSNQLNTILQKLDIPLDLGLNYKPDEKGNNIFDVAVSTQLFNNRVVVNGNIGSKQYSSSSNNKNDVVGDIDIEIKLDRKGAFRLKLFSHSADQYTNYLDNSQKNGIGLTYQTEFNNIGTWIKNIFSSKEKRRRNMLEEEEALLNEGKNIIRIEKSDKANNRNAAKKNGKR